MKILKILQNYLAFFIGYPKHCKVYSQIFKKSNRMSPCEMDVPVVVSVSVILTTSTDDSSQLCALNIDFATGKTH